MSISKLPNFISSGVSKGRYFFLNLEPKPRVDLTVVCGGYEVCDPNYRVGREAFPYFAIEYVAEGQGTLTVRDSEHALYAGSVFAYGPHMPYHVKTDSHHVMAKYFVDFSGRDAEALLHAAKLSRGIPRRLLRTFWFQSLFDQLLETGRSANSLAFGHSKLLLQTMISRLKIDACDAHQTETAAYETYMHCAQYVEQTYLQLASITQWAEACHVDRAYLSRLFRRYSSRSPYQLLTQLKIDHAVDAMVRRGMSIKQAAQIVGFDDPQHFSRVFKRTRGLAPSQFLQLVPQRIKASS